MVVNPGPASPRITLPPEPAWREFARSPLVPVGLAASVGLIADRYLEAPLNGEFLLTALAVAAWLFAQRQRSLTTAVWLWLAAGALAAAHHHIHRHGFAADSIGRFTSDRVNVVRIRGTLDEEPARFRAPRPDPLLTLQKTETTTTILAVSQIATADGWQPASGRAKLTVEGRLDDIHLGDSVEVTGQLYAPNSPANPGEMDYRSLL